MSTTETMPQQKPDSFTQTVASVLRESNVHKIVSLAFTAIANVLPISQLILIVTNSWLIYLVSTAHPNQPENSTVTKLYTTQSILLYFNVIAFFLAIFIWATELFIWTGANVKLEISKYVYLILMILFLILSITFVTLFAKRKKYTTKVNQSLLITFGIMTPIFFITTILLSKDIFYELLLEWYKLVKYEVFDNNDDDDDDED